MRDPRKDPRLDLILTVFDGDILTASPQSFLPFSGVPCKGKGTTSMIRKTCSRAAGPMGGTGFPTDHAQPTQMRSWSPCAHDLEPGMKKPKIEVEEQQPRKIIRADKAPTEGYSLVVDGHFKSHHDTVEAAEEAGMALKNQYQMLQVQVYDAATKTRSMIEWPAPA